MSGLASLSHLVTMTVVVSELQSGQVNPANGRQEITQVVSAQIRSPSDSHG
jgi:hypothetical protein